MPEPGARPATLRMSRTGDGYHDAHFSVHGKNVGYASVGVPLSRQVHVAVFAIRGRMQGVGYGRLFYSALEAEIRNRWKPKSIFLEAPPESVKFWRKLGFANRKGHMWKTQEY